MKHRQVAPARWFEMSKKNWPNLHSDVVHFLTLVSSWSLICPVNHSIPSWRPSPVTALLAQMCQGLSMILSRPRVWDTFTLDRASLMSILLAKNRIGIFLEREVVWFWTSNWYFVVWSLNCIVTGWKMIRLMSKEDYESASWVTLFMDGKSWRELLRMLIHSFSRLVGVHFVTHKFDHSSSTVPNLL